jgi:hypothetical protein
MTGPKTGGRSALPQTCAGGQNLEHQLARGTLGNGLRKSQGELKIPSTFNYSRLLGIAITSFAKESDYATYRDLTISESSDDAPHRKDGFRAGQTPVTCTTDSDRRIFR